jgi:hypothetical protein
VFEGLPGGFIDSPHFWVRWTFEFKVVLELGIMRSSDPSFCR